MSRQARQFVEMIASKRSLLDATRLSSLLKTQPTKEPLRFSPRDMPTVHSLAKEVAVLIRHANEMLGQCELPALTARQAYSYSRAWRRRPEASDEHLEVIETRRVAFPFFLAIAALEQTVMLMLAAQCQPALLHLPDNIVALKFLSSGIDEDQQPRQFESVYVGKMVVDSGGAVFCWRCMASDSYESNRLEETGWGMVERETTALADGGTSFSYLSRFEGDKKLVEMVEATGEETAVWFNTMESVVMQRVGASVGI